MFNQENFETASLEAIIASFKQIRPFLLNQQDVGKIETKPDDTLLTIADRLSENAGFEILRHHFPDVPIIREESGLSDGSADWQIWYDPLDGTAPFTIGAPTSTVICAAYDTINKSLLSVAIGEPAYKRIWVATKNNGCWLIILDDNYNIQAKLPKKVWDGNLSSSTAVFLDLTRGFARDKGQRQILSNTQMKTLVASLSLETRLQLYGSNGLHQALVANGNEKVVGGITTAMGGPWDVAGALLIEEAGGKCQAWRFTTDGQITSADCLDPLSYDILVYANNATTLAFLRHCLNSTENRELTEADPQNHLNNCCSQHQNNHLIDHCFVNEHEWEDVGKIYREPNPGIFGNKTFLFAFFRRCCGKSMLRYRLMQRQQCSHCGNTSAKELGQLAVCQVCEKAYALERHIAPY